MKKVFYLVICSCLLLGSCKKRSDIQFFDDFDELPKHKDPKDVTESEIRYSYHSLVEKEDQKPLNNSLQIIEDGELSYLKSTLSPGQLHKKIRGYRAELTLHGGNPELKEEWIEWRFMIPKDYKLDSTNIGREVSIVQFHYVKPKSEEKIITGPTVDFTYLEQYSKNMLILHYGINGVKNGLLHGNKWRPIALNDEIIKGQWYTVRVNINWSLTNTGYIAVWLNGKPFTPYNGINNKVYGANLYNSIQNTLKFGFYRYWDNSNPTSINFDYMKKARSYMELTGKEPTPMDLYGTSEDYRYLEDKKRVLSEISLREEKLE
ncbi:heparin lyase I family protein [Flagellimonas myxillae]|uniref:heparin lyase I family protein n=1 Tax=Flagellimonas myxillae TaxID=2942214 RepID=UPI00201F9532|nr:heparin lyase I family protein [Muricauda myxillae]MCL6266666.1 polysaccharide lyase [Muricauda myxillae]